MTTWKRIKKYNGVRAVLHITRLYAFLSCRTNRAYGGSGYSRNDTCRIAVGMKAPHRGVAEDQAEGYMSVPEGTDI
jgi:hypothetical protein